MARPRRQDARRSEIITAATVAIAERGLIGLRLKDIAEAAAMSAARSPITTQNSTTSCSPSTSGPSNGSTGVGERP